MPHCLTPAAVVDPSLGGLAEGRPYGLAVATMIMRGLVCCEVTACTPIHFGELFLFLFPSLSPLPSFSSFAMPAFPTSRCLVPFSLFFFPYLSFSLSFMPFHHTRCFLLPSFFLPLSPSLIHSFLISTISFFISCFSRFFVKHT